MESLQSISKSLKVRRACLCDTLQNPPHPCNRTFLFYDPLTSPSYYYIQSYPKGQAIVGEIAMLWSSTGSSTKERSEMDPPSTFRGDVYSFKY